MKMVKNIRINILEQEEVIRGFKSRSRFQNILYRVSLKIQLKFKAIFITAGLFLSFIYFYLGYISDIFSESLNPLHARLVHLLTGVGFVLMCFRILTMKYKKRRVQNRNSDSISSEYFEPEVYSKTLFYVVLFISVFEIIFLGPTLYEYLSGKRAYIHFNWNLVIFQALLPFFSMLTEYALGLLLQTDSDIFDLMGYKYHYKKL